MSIVASPKCIIIGMPASGKSRVGKQLAQNLGLDFKDLDLEIEKEEKCSISEIFDKKGEGYFRSVEFRCLEKLLTEFKGVLALGGGSVSDDNVYQALNQYKMRDGQIIYLDVDVNIATERIKNKVLRGENKRPMFNNLGELDIRAKWLDLKNARERKFLDASSVKLSIGTKNDAYCDNDDLALNIAKDLEGLFSNQIVNVRQKYQVIIGDSNYSMLKFHLQKSKKVCIFYTDTVKKHLDEQVLPNILNICQNENVYIVKIPDAEKSKTCQNFASQLEYLAQNKFNRDDILVGLGGGAVTDFVGFVASTYLRGIKYISLPTSTLAMIDASVGGKTGINLASGKNLCGSFYEPEVVIANIDTLNTLQKREFNEGIAEAIKMGFVFDQRILDALNFNDIHRVIYLCVKKKAEIVTSDFKENGIRALLNYGHTVGHIIEKLEDYQIRHGEAVSIGMIFAINLAFELEYVEESVLENHYDMLEKWSLPISWKFNNIQYDKIVSLLLNDKKVVDNSVRFILLSGDQMPQIVSFDLEKDKEVFIKVLNRVSQ